MPFRGSFFTCAIAISFVAGTYSYVSSLSPGKGAIPACISWSPFTSNKGTSFVSGVISIIPISFGSTVRSKSAIKIAASIASKRACWSSLVLTFQGWQFGSYFINWGNAFLPDSLTSFFFAYSRTSSTSSGIRYSLFSSAICRQFCWRSISWSLNGDPIYPPAFASAR